MRACLFYSLCDLNDLFLALHRTRSRHNNQALVSTDFYTAHINDSIIRMELSAACFIWFAYPSDSLYNSKALKQFPVYFGCVADSAYNCPVFTM